MKTIISADKAFAYAKLNFPEFPSDWYISKNFTWNDVFKNELKEYGVPPLIIFQKAVKSSIEFQKARDLIGKPFNVHCWYRSNLHNLKLKQQGLNPAMHSAHLLAMAIDYDVTGLTESQVRTSLVKLVKEDKLHIRIEPNTVGWVHMDVGSEYLNDYNWGVIKM